MSDGPAPALRTDDYYLGASTARRVPSKRSPESLARDLTFGPGERWLWDLTPLFEGAFDGYRYVVIFVCRRTLFVRLYALRDKSAASFIANALEPLRVFVQTTLPGTRLLSIHGDSDTCLSQSGHGADQDNSYLKAYNSRLADPILVVRSPADVHAMNGCEPQAKRLYFLANQIHQRWYLGRAFTIDTLFSACEILDDTPVPGSIVAGLKGATRRELFTGQKTDISRWQAEPGQSAWVHVAGAKANMGAAKAKAAIFLYPLPGAGGFVLRLLDTRRLVVAYSISVVADRDVRHARLLASEDLRVAAAPGTVDVGTPAAARIRSLFAANPNVDPDFFVVRTDPLTRAAVRL
jgi:hypothetical protein